MMSLDIYRIILSLQITQRRKHNMIEEKYLEQLMKMLEAPQQDEGNFFGCQIIGKALSYPRNIPKKFRNYITYETNFMFYDTFNLPHDKKLTKQDFRQMQEELANRIFEEFYSPTYIVGTIGAFEYFSLFHALRLLRIPQWKIPALGHQGNYAYYLAYGLFRLDAGTNVLPKDEYSVCNQFDWAIKAATEKMTEK